VLITPTLGVTVTTARPVFDWVDATDDVGVVSYTMVLTGPVAGRFVAAASAYTRTLNLLNGGYVWTVVAYDAAGNSSDPVIPESFVVRVLSQIYLPLVVRNE